ncbi:MAG: hypothetical protein K1X79_01725 [Oligoflexia bacterium]|nr:hypothetical protein [Oligoflexia bacterium]
MFAIKKFFRFALPVALLASFSGCAELNYPNDSYGYGGYSDPYYDHDRYDHHDRYDRERDRWNDREKHRLDRERHELEEERRRLEEERERQEREKHERPQHDFSPPQPPPQDQLHCPPGTHPSTHRCTKEERKRGCKDYGAGDGRGCSNF